MEWKALLGPKFPGISSVQEKRLCSLWAGYGHVSKLLLEPQRIRLVAKQVRPPAASGISHERKVHSYEVESAWYSGPAQYAASAGVHLPKPVAVQRQDNEFTLVLTDLEEEFPNKSTKGTMGIKELKPALEWLARFHSAFWGSSQPSSEGRPSIDQLWPQGTFWHLGTRQEEFESMGSEWRWLADKAHEIDARLRGYPNLAASQAGGPPSSPHLTVCHGDFKAANLLFSSDWSKMAAYDYQYVGRGLGASDLAYLIICSSSPSVVEKDEQELLEHYHHHLMANLRERGTPDETYTMQVLRTHYDLAALDLWRFMAGWGWWGAVSPRQAQQKGKEIVARLAL